MGTSDHRFYGNFKEEANRFFEIQLENLDLGRRQIEGQSLPELGDRLVRVDDALKKAESFGTIRLRMTPTTGILLRHHI